VDEDDHRQVRLAGRGTPDVEVEAILAADGSVQRRRDRLVVGVVRAGAVDPAVLDAGIAERLRRLDPEGRDNGVDRRLPAQVADWRLRESNSLPGVGACGGGVVIALD